MVGAGLVGGQSINLLGKTALNRAGELITEMAKRGTKDAIVFGGLGTAMQNKINKAFDVAENDEYLKSALHMAIIGSMFALHAGYGKVKPLSKQKANEIDYLASYLPEEYTRKQVEQLVQQGKLGAADGEEISDKLNTYRTIRNQIPAELSSNQMEQIYPLWVERRRLQSMTKDASSEFKSVLNGEVEDIDRKILVKAAVPLTSSERAEKNKLSTAEAENKDIDKSRLRYLEQRDEASKEVKAEKKFTREKQQGEVGDTETFDNKGNKIADAESSKGGDGEDAKPEAETGVEAVAENGKEEVVAEVVEPVAKETKPEDSMLSEGESKPITSPEIEAKKAKLKAIKESKNVAQNKTGCAKISPKTPGAKISTVEGAGADSFQIISGDDNIMGYVRNVDFPGERGGDPNRGELLMLGVRSGKKKGTGTKLVQDALRLLRKNGIERFKATSPSKEGSPFLDALEKKGMIELIRTHERGTREYYIRDIDGKTAKPTPEEKSII